MDDNQLHIFAKAFLEANNGEVKFPKRFQLDKINEIEFYTEGMRGGYKVRFFIKENSMGEWFLDLYGGNDYCSWHKRINKKGEIINLESFKGEFGRLVYPNDPKRTEREHQEIQENNDSVYRLLLEKGLKQNFDNPEFEKNHVIKLTDYDWK